MAYTKQTWADLPSKTTPINANRLTHIEDGIFNAAATADNAASTAGTAAANVGIVSGKVETLTDRVNGLDTAVSNKVDKVAGKGLSTNDYNDTDKGKVDSLGTASTKNSTSVVTESSDLVESGAVKELVGWGNKNQLKLTLTELKAVNGFATWSGNTMSYNGCSITFIEMDGFVTSISINGTVTSAFNVRLTDTRNLGYQGKILNGTVDIDKEYVYAYDDALPGSVSDSGNGVTIPDTFTNYRIVLNIKAVAHNEVIYPMISKDGGAYEPYHASVEESKCDNSVIAPVENGSTASQAYAVREHFIRDGAFCTCKQAISQGGSFTLNTNYTAGDVADNLVKTGNYSGTTDASGHIVILDNAGTKKVLSVMDDANYRMALIFKENNKIYAKLLNLDMTALINSAVSGTYYYID